MRLVIGFPFSVEFPLVSRSDDGRCQRGPPSTNAGPDAVRVTWIEDPKSRRAATLARPVPLQVMLRIAFAVSNYDCGTGGILYRCFKAAFLAISRPFGDLHVRYACRRAGASLAAAETNVGAVRSLRRASAATAADREAAR